MREWEMCGTSFAAFANKWVNMFEVRQRITGYVGNTGRARRGTMDEATTSAAFVVGRPRILHCTTAKVCKVMEKNWSLVSLLACLFGMCMPVSVRTGAKVHRHHTR